MLEHLLALIDDNLPVPQLPTTPLSAPIYIPPEPPTATQIAIEKLKPYNVDMPFTAFDKRRILENMLFTEALMAGKAADRIKAVELLGKTEQINIFAAEKKIIEVKDVDELRQRVSGRLEALLGEAVDAEVLPCPSTS